MLYIATNVMLPGKSVLDVKNRLESLTGRRIIEAWCDDYNVVELKENIAEVIKWCSKHKYEPAFYEDAFCIE
jgi:hypothetical protein